MNAEIQWLIQKYWLAQLHHEVDVSGSKHLSFLIHLGLVT